MSLQTRFFRLKSITTLNVQFGVTLLNIQPIGRLMRSNQLLPKLLNLLKMNLQRLLSYRTNWTISALSEQALGAGGEGEGWKRRGERERIKKESLRVLRGGCTLWHN